MTVKTEKPYIIQIKFRQEPSDPHYGSCLWALFNFDMDNWILSIQSDCGDYAHRWPNENDIYQSGFIQFCAGIGKDYMLDKMCRKTWVDIPATKGLVMDYLTESEFDQEVIDEAVESLERLFEEYDLQDCVPAAQEKIEEWNEENGLEIDPAYELIVDDYDPMARRIARIFDECIRPELRRILKEGRT